MPTLTEHQWKSVKNAAEWYKEADRNRDAFIQLEDTYASDLIYDQPRTGIGKGQDFFFGGYAGTGKTTVLPAVIEEMGLSPDNVAFCAPTGKAAKVMGEKLKAFGMPVTPTTIHKLIYLPNMAKADVIESNINHLTRAIVAYKTNGTPIYYDGNQISLPQAESRLLTLGLDLKRAMNDDDDLRFSLRPLDEMNEQIKLVVVDEASMVGKSIADDLALFGRPLLAFGDPGQLPPVGEKYGFNVTKPDTFLTEIHRQAADNPIIYLATKVRNGEDLKIGNYGDDVKVVPRSKDDVTLDVDRDAMVLCGTHKKRWALTSRIRSALGYTETGPCEGEPLLVCRNSRKYTSLVNGTIVTNCTEHGDLQKGAAQLQVTVKEGDTSYVLNVVQSIFEEHVARKKNVYTAPYRDAFKAKKNCEHLDFGHVLTVHKSQGSQWDDVVVHDEGDSFRDEAYRWRYTGITRAAEKLTVVV